MPTSEGRRLLVRPALFGEGIHLAILGKRGAIVEGAGVRLDHVPGLIMAIDGISEVAWAQNEKQLRRSRRERERRHAEALARNPWLKSRLKKEEVTIYE